MRLVAGVDVGNTTTEVVVAELTDGLPRPVAWDRSPTRSVKGSAASLHGAAVLLRRVERRLGRSADVIVAAPLRPVSTSSASLSQPPVATGRLEVVPAGGLTPGATGVGVGVPVWISAPTVLGTPVVLLVPAGTGYQAAVALTRGWLDAGAQVRALVLADDEGVLVSARLPAQTGSGAPLPVADEVDVDRLAGAPRVAVEVRPPGYPMRELADPIRLSWLMGLDAGERADAAAVAATLAGTARAVVALRSARQAVGPAAGGWLELRGSPGRIPLTTGVADVVRTAPVGAVRTWSRTGAAQEALDDLWLVELGDVAGSVAARAEPHTARALVVAALRSGAESVDPGGALASELDRPVRVAGSEAAAARAGATTTPGVRSSATVVDVGGGTIDVVAADGREVVAAGAGELLTVAVATFLALPRGAADWVKRGPSSRLEAPQLLASEDGERTFLDRPGPSAAVGSLVVAGPVGLLPFGGRLAPAEWRALRLRTKQRLLADNVVRALRTLDEPPGDLLLVGGAAADDELVAQLGPLLPAAAVGRGDVAGALGHRYAVAYGLTVLVEP